MQRRRTNKDVWHKLEFLRRDDHDRLAEHLQRCRRIDAQKIVLACGCFDLLHVGHLRLLRTAADMGDLLIIGLNSDWSIRMMKGPDRPIIPLVERAEMIASLEGVTYITYFIEDDPRRLIEKIKPDIYVKGSDYTEKDLVEASTVTENGGQIVLLPYTQGHSTTGLIRRLMRQED